MQKSWRAELFKMMAGVDMIHVPYPRRGAAPSETQMRSITVVRFVPFTRSQD
jgi:hypothetical protein